MSLLHLLEPEETIGTLWHRMVGDRWSIAHFPDAAVTFEQVAPRLRVYFRGLGGDRGAELKPAVPGISHHRLSRRQRLGIRHEKVPLARYDGHRFSLPESLDVMPRRELNERLYFWLAAWTAVAPEEPLGQPEESLPQDLARLDHADRTSRAVLARFPGLAKTYAELCRETLSLRPVRALPEAEAAVEACIRHLLGGTDQGATAAPEAASAGYRTYLPVPLWGELEVAAASGGAERGGDEEPGGGRQAGGDGRMRKAKRRRSDSIDRRGGLFVHRFEKILTWTEFMNLHRDVEDDDEESARKAADDHDEIGVGKLKKRAATRLKIDLDLSPADVEAEQLSGQHLYPEWDWRRQAYHAAHTRVLERMGEIDGSGTGWQPGPLTERRIRAVRRQFEALRPRREVLSRQLDGHELDMDALVRAKADLAASGEGSDRIYRQAREQARDLSVAVLIDVSRSTESFVQDRPVIDIEREALIALAEGLEASGDESAILAFSSLRRDRVFVSRLKDFGEKPGPLVRQRIGALRPGFYTRLGAAVRHATAQLTTRPSRKKLLLVLTDGKPNDLDHYEGRYGIEDTRKAVEEARRQGQAVFAITIDDKAQSYVSRIFGAKGFAIVPHPARLTAALPVLYRHLIA